MYVHAYQSYIWNLVASQRIKLSSTDVLVGDLVYVHNTAENEDEETRGRSISWDFSDVQICPLSRIYSKR